MKQIITAILISLFAVIGVSADNPDKKSKKDTFTLDKPAHFETQHSGSFNGTKISYKAIAGDTFIRDENGNPTATFFSTAYIKDGVKDSSTRPVTFIFNGGPGSASMWLHMGVFGPRRVDIPSDPADDGSPPYKVENNIDTLLDVSDLVFIDPMGTGLTRPLNGADPKKHWGVMEDGKSVATFIRTWVDNNERWNSPKFIAGESYGTVRSAVVSDILTNQMGMGLNGIILISAVLDYQNSRIQEGSLMSYVSFLPSFAATAWYHDALPNKPENLEVFLDEVRDFARTEYLNVLVKGNRATLAENSAITDKLHGYTGLKKSFLKASNNRIHVFRFFKELLRDKGLVVGRIDSRYTGTEREAAGEVFKGDPFFAAVGNAYTTGMNEHLRKFLGVKLEKRRYNSNARAMKGWDWNWLMTKKPQNGGRFINVIPILGKAMRNNPDMHVLVTSGYYDFATPFFGAENALAEEDIVKDQLHFTYYEAGHMMYLHDASRAKFLDDIRAFMQDRLR